MYRRMYYLHIPKELVNPYLFFANHLGIPQIVFASAFHLASIVASGGTDWEQEKIREEFDDVWMATIGSDPTDPRYIRVTSDIDKLHRYLLSSLFYSPTPMGRLPETFFHMYSQETGLLMFERLEGFDHVPNG